MTLAWMPRGALVVACLTLAATCLGGADHRFLAAAGEFRRSVGRVVRVLLRMHG